MKISKIELQKVTASAGMVLTNGEAYSKEIYLGKNDNADNWYEITEEEYAVILEKEREELNNVLS